MARKIHDTGHLLHDFHLGLGFSRIARRYGYANLVEAREAVNKVIDRRDRALRGDVEPLLSGADKSERKILERLDKQARRRTDALRARELLLLEKLENELDENGDPGDSKVVAERRLLSESRRRMYAMDLQRDGAGGPQVVVIDARPPWERQEPPKIKQEPIELAQIEEVSGRPDADGPPLEDQDGPSGHPPRQDEA